MHMSEFSLIIADHPLMRAGIKEVVSADRLFNLVGYAQTGGECLELIAVFHGRQKWPKEL